jgi:4-carboxymuconolactone decarboxylase
MTESPEQRHQRGLAKMNEVYGWDMPDQKGDFFAITADHLFADIWTRPGLTVRERRLLLIGALAASGKHDILDIQLDSALRLGELDAEGLREIVIFLAHYLGWPSAAILNGRVEALIAKQREA